ncbi:hypothetical protein M3J81_001247 [Listeria monocytogenes]|nr:hypothetical protein [Listeria monocytogenes]
MRLILGDIIKNNSAKHPDMRFSIFLKIDGNYIYVIRLVNNKLEEGRLYTAQLKQTYSNGKSVLEVVGHSESFLMMKRDIYLYSK